MWQLKLYIHPNLWRSLTRLHVVMNQKNTSEYSFTNKSSPSGRYLCAIAGIAETWLQTPPYLQFLRTTLMTYVNISWQSLIDSRTACTFMKNRSAAFVSCLKSDSKSFPSFYLCLGFPSVLSFQFPHQNILRSYLLVLYIYIYIYIYISSPTHGSLGLITLRVLHDNLGVCQPVVFPNVKLRILCVLVYTALVYW